MKKFLLLLMMVLCGTIAMWSKQNPVRGYIITNSGDTISGTIDYQTRGKMARACHFQPDGEMSYVTYQPGQIAPRDPDVLRDIRNPDPAWSDSRFPPDGRWNLLRHKDVSRRW